jgi:hypothetical protein
MKTTSPTTSPTTSLITDQPEFTKFINRRTRLVAWSRTMARIATSEIERRRQAAISTAQIELAIAR